MLQDECLELSSDVSNWRPIFAKLIHTRIAPLLDANQCHDQDGFRPNLGVDHVFATLDSIVGRCFEWNEPLWIASLDLRKAFDRIELGKKNLCFPHLVIKKSRRLTFIHGLVYPPVTPPRTFASSSMTPQQPSPCTLSRRALRVRSCPSVRHKLLVWGASLPCASLRAV